MKTILCYGDSNTWGWNPATKERLPRNMRWTGVLRQELGPEYEIIEEGLNGRTTVWDDPIESNKNGKKYLLPCLETHKPIDLVVLMLGTNDLKNRFSVSALDIANGVGVLVDIIQKSSSGLDGLAPQVLLMCPPQIAKLTEFADMFIGAYEKSEKLSKHYRKISEQFKCYYLDTSEHISSSELDGIHFDTSEHQKLGKVVAGTIKSIL